MTSLRDLLTACWLALHPQREADQTFLARAADANDLELRLRALEARDRHRERDFVLGLYPSR